MPKDLETLPRNLQHAGPTSAVGRGARSLRGLQGTNPHQVSSPRTTMAGEEATTAGVDLTSARPSVRRLPSCTPPKRQPSELGRLTAVDDLMLDLPYILSVQASIPSERDDRHHAPERAPPPRWPRHPSGLRLELPGATVAPAFKNVRRHLAGFLPSQHFAPPRRCDPKSHLNSKIAGSLRSMCDDPTPSVSHVPMTPAQFTFDTLDDLMRGVFDTLLSNGNRISPTKGVATEHTGVLLELRNPRARLSRTETRGKPFSCLGELCWYLSGSDDVGFIEYYIPGYRTYANGDQIFGAYGPRLANEGGQHQIANVVQRLREHPHSRRAVVQLFRASDLVSRANDIPCTCTLQFLRRQNVLHMLTNMRSNDAYTGLPHDIFAFTMLQEIVARDLSIDVGSYKHMVGSLHLYDSNRESARQFLGEGLQSTQMPMPAMPTGDPWPSIASLLDAESSLRGGQSLASAYLDRSGAEYWSDLMRLLEFFQAYKMRDTRRAHETRQRMTSPIYLPFFDDKLRKLDDVNDNPVDGKDLA